MAMTLGCIVATQIGNLFAQRSDHLPIWRVGLGGNRLLWLGVASELAILLLILHVPLLREAFGVAPFPASGWLFLLACAPLLLVADELRKGLPAKRSG